jgi:hypothetical protein
MEALRLEYEVLVRYYIMKASTASVEIEALHRSRLINCNTPLHTRPAGSHEVTSSRRGGIAFFHGDDVNVAVNQEVSPAGSIEVSPVFGERHARGYRSPVSKPPSLSLSVSPSQSQEHATQEQEQVHEYDQEQAHDGQPYEQSYRHSNPQSAFTPSSKSVPYKHDIGLVGSDSSAPVPSLPPHVPPSLPLPPVKDHSTLPLMGNESLRDFEARHIHEIIHRVDAFINRVNTGSLPSLSICVSCLSRNIFTSMPPSSFLSH